MDLPADFAARPYTGMQVHVGVAGPDRLDELLECAGFDSPVTAEDISGINHAGDRPLGRWTWRFIDSAAEERNHAAIDGALSEMDVGRGRGGSFERCVAQLVGDESIFVVNARGEETFAGRRDRVDLLVAIQVGPNVPYPSGALGHGVRGSS